MPINNLEGKNTSGGGHLGARQAKTEVTVDEERDKAWLNNGNIQ